jgi:hypothetical protein
MYERASYCGVDKTLSGGCRPMRRLGSTFAAAALVSLGVVSLGVPATASASAQSDKAHYRITYGRADYSAEGNITWTNRTIFVGGKVNAIEYNCAKVVVRADHGRYSTSTSRTVCSGERGYSFKLQLNVRGGVASANVRLYISPEGRHHHWKAVGGLFCDRTGCSQGSDLNV